MTVELFVVKHYHEQPHPTIKGNGFDGLVLGNFREEAEDFIKFVNKLIAAQNTIECVAVQQATAKEMK